MEWLSAEDLIREQRRHVEAEQLEHWDDLRRLAYASLRDAARSAEREVRVAYADGDLWFVRVAVANELRAKGYAADVQGNLLIVRW